MGKTVTGGSNGAVGVAGPERRRTMLLMGPTGSGKTPLGRLLEIRGFRGEKCRHFDFGERLRTAAARGPEHPLNAEDIAVIRHSLATGALLGREDHQLAGKLLSVFIGEGPVGDGSMLVLNGFPRDVEQAGYIETQGAAGMELVVSLEASSEVVLDRIEHDPAGDRQGRVDDSAEAVLARLQTYVRRTRPVLEYYRERGTRIIAIKVLPGLTAEDMLGLISR